MLPKERFDLSTGSLFLLQKRRHPASTAQEKIFFAAPLFFSSASFSFA